MITFLFILSILSTLFAIVSTLLLIRFAKRTLEFDRLFDLLSVEIDAILVYTSDLMKKPLLSNAPEVVEFDRRVREVQERMVMYSLAINEMRPLGEAPAESEERSLGPPPKVVD